MASSAKTSRDEAIIRLVDLGGVVTVVFVSLVGFAFTTTTWFGLDRTLAAAAARSFGAEEPCDETVIGNESALLVTDNTLDNESTVGCNATVSCFCIPGGGNVAAAAAAACVDC